MNGEQLFHFYHLTNFNISIFFSFFVFCFVSVLFNDFYVKAGVVLGVSISIVFITICLCSIYCRRKFESSRSLRNEAQPAKGRVLSRNGNGCCVEQSSASLSQQANAVGGAANEIELAVLRPSSPIETNPHSDAKVIN